MKEAIFYHYYRTKKLNPQYGNAIIAIQFSMILLIHLIPLINIVDQVFHVRILSSFFDLVRDDDVITRRFIKLPVLFSPMFIAMYLFLQKYNQELLEAYDRFPLMPIKQKKRMNAYLWVYIVGSFLFFLIGLTSSDWVPKLT